ncbi:condensin-2 complex subunit D3-like [Scleropages formosus]|uniref:Condensin-2 complex subunit D3 n=1 Tax=Scleropages formosus TaxID=113540 RepID=A0A0P7V6X1_SCLFO|nr:condensin-2 complex subunit D3-like [Scleropages formosus]
MEVWVTAVWDVEFMDAEPLDPGIEEEILSLGPQAFSTLHTHLLCFATDSDSRAESLWAVLGENGVSTSALVAVLSHFIIAIRSKTNTLNQRLCALQAASLYLLLLGVPGKCPPFSEIQTNQSSVANKVFHPVVFDTCLGLLKKCWPQDASKKRKQDSFKSSQADSKARKRSKPPRKDDEELEMDEFEEEDQGEEIFLSGQELLALKKAMVSLVKTLLTFLTKFSLKGKPQCVQNCAQVFTELTAIEPVPGHLSFASETNINDTESLPELAYHGLRLLCSPKHGEGNETVQQVFHRLLYVILMMNGENSSRPTPLVPTQAVLAAKGRAVRFVSHIVDELKEAVLPTLRILLQHICAQTVDKAEYRSSGAQAVLQLLAKMPCAEYASFIKWLYGFSLHSKAEKQTLLLGGRGGGSMFGQVAYRMFALDVVMALIEQPERQPEVSLPAELVPYLQHRFLIQVMVFGRRSDRAPTVRAHALACLAQCLELQSPSTAESIQELFSTTKETISLLKRRSSDEKSNAVMSLLKHNVIPCSQENLFILSDRCRDPAVSVKKKALQCLMDLLLALPGSSLVQKAWLRGVVPAVIDSESSVQEKAAECLEQAILSQIKSYNSYREQDISQKLAWDLLLLLCGENQDLGRYFSKAFAIWSKQNKFSSTFVNNLISHTEAEHAPAAWLLLSKVAGSCPRLNYSKILDAWDEMIRKTNVTVSTSCHILCVIGEIARHLNEETKSRIVGDIMKWLKSFELPLEVIGACVETLVQLVWAKAVVDTQICQFVYTFKLSSVLFTQRSLNKYCGELVSISESFLSSVILSEDGQQNFNEDLVVKHLYTLGVAALQCPAMVGKRIFLLVQSILASNVELPSADVNKELPATQPVPQFKPSSMPTVIRAHAFVTLGKLCLQNEDLAKRCIPALARELEVSTEVPVRSNVVMVMCDLCVRYTTMVDRYIPNISACLKDEEPIIRQQTLILLTNLLQEEFVKWKGSLFFRFVVVLVDPEPSIASLCEFCLIHLLLKRNPVMFSQHFIECIFHFNCYEKHDKYNKFLQTASEKARFSLQGAKNKEKRMKLYKFLLEHFTDEQRFNITNKISQNILASFVDGVLPLDTAGAELLSDTFDVLSLKEIKLSAMCNPVDRDEQMEDEPMAMAMANAVMQVQKRNFIENVIPIIISLKAMLEKNRFPVLRDLMTYLKVMMQDYRSEVKEFFAADEQLAAELEYDMKRFQKEQEMVQQLANSTITEAVPVAAAGHAVTTESASASTCASPAARAGPRSQSVFATPQPPCLTPQIFLSPKTVGVQKRQTLSTTEVLTKARRSVDRHGLHRCHLGLAGDENKTPLNESAILKQQLHLSSYTEGSAVGNRAISTPQRSMSEVTFGEGVSAIFSAHRTEPKDFGNTDNVLFLMSPDKPRPRLLSLEPCSCRSKHEAPAQQMATVMAKSTATTTSTPRMIPVMLMSSGGGQGAKAISEAFLSVPRVLRLTFDTRSSADLPTGTDLGTLHLGTTGFTADHGKKRGDVIL